MLNQVGQTLTAEQQKNYRNLQREIVLTENQLKNLQVQASNWTQVSANLTDFGNKMKNIGTTITDVGKKVSVLSGAGAGLFGAGVKYNADIEKYQTAFKTFLGSEEDAVKAINNIKEASKSSPFSTSDLVQANQMLITTGESAEESQKTISALADAIALTGGSNDTLSRMASNLQQIKNVEKANAMDIRQFGMAGIDIYGILAETTGKTTAEVKKMDITYEELAKAFQVASSEGGKYYKGQAKMTDTLSGKISKLKKSFQDLTGQLSASLMPIIQKVTDKIQKFADWFGNLDDKQKETITKIGLLVVALGPALIIIGKIITAVGIISGALGTLAGAIATATSAGGALAGIFTFMTGPIGIIIAVIGALVGAFVLLYNKCDWFREGVDTILQNVKEFFVNTFEAIGKFFTETIPEWINSAIEWFKNLPYNIGYFLGQILGNIVKFGVNAWNWVTTELPKIIGKIIDWFKSLPSKIWEGLLSAIERIREWLTNVKNLVVEKVPQIVDSIINFFKDLPNNIKNIGENIVKGLWEGITNMGDWLKNKLKDFANGILDGFKDSLGIHSPSLVFKNEIGKNIALGVGVGFEKNISSVMDSMSNKMLKETANLSGDINMVSNLAGVEGELAKGETNNVSINVQFYPQSMTEAELNNAFNYINRRFGLAY